MRKFNKLFILISIILLSFTCISCNKSDEERMREIFELEQLNMYVDISNEKSGIVSRLKDSVEWSDKLVSDVDYYSLTEIYNKKVIKHLFYAPKLYSSTTYAVNNKFVPNIVELVSSIPYVEITSAPFLSDEICYFLCYKSSDCDCGCNDIDKTMYIFIFDNKYVGLNIIGDGKSRDYVSLIPLDDRLRKVLSEENVHVYIKGKELD